MRTHMQNKAQPKEEHPVSYPDGEVAPSDPYGFPVKYRSPVVPPQGGDAAIPIQRVPWSDLPVSPLTGLPYDPELISNAFALNLRLMGHNRMWEDQR